MTTKRDLKKKTVPFPRLLGPKEVSAVVAAHYKSTVRRSVSEVTFDFSRVEWCDPLSLSYVVLWMSESHKLGKVTRFSVPSGEARSADRDADSRIRRIGVLGFLVSQRFIEFAVGIGAVSGEDLPRSVSGISRKDLDSAVSPLIFFHRRESFSAFMALLGDDDQYRMKLAEVWDVPAVSRFELRDIVIREIGDNAFDHAGGQFAHLMMTNHPPISSSETSSKIRARRDAWKAKSEAAPAPERAFLQRVSDRGLLTLIIADKGPGIPATLGQAYAADSILPSKKPEPSALDLLEYSLLQHSSSKTREQRLGELARAIASDEELPATGISWVREVARAHRAFLEIRCGGAVYSLDFLNYPRDGRPGVASRDGDADERMAPFGGTIVRMLLPYPGERRPVATVVPPERNADANPPEYLYFLLDEVPDTAGATGQDRDLCNWLLRQQEGIQAKCLTVSRPAVLVVDCAAFTGVQHSALKAFFLLVLDVMRLRPDELSVVMLHVSDACLRIAAESRPLHHDGPGIQKERAVAVLGDDGAIGVLGLSEDESSVLEHAFRGETTDSGSDAVLARLSHLATKKPDGRLQWQFSASGVTPLVIARYERQLQAVILTPENGVYFPTGCFLLPSAAFSEGYFDIHSLIANPKWRRVVLEWLRLQVERADPTTVVSLCTDATELMTSLATSFSKWDLVALRDPKRELWKIAIEGRSGRVLVVTDVIGTQQTLDTALEYVESNSVVGILTIVDARRLRTGKEVEVRGSRYAVASIVRHPLRYWTEDKPARFSYEQIVRVDPVTHSPLPNRRGEPSPIWKSLNWDTGANEFSDEVLRAADALVVGHVESQRHLTYLFVTPRIATIYARQVAEVVRTDIADYSSLHLGGDIPVTLVLYPDSSPGADEFSRQIAVSLGSCRVRAVTADELRRPEAYPRPQETGGATLVFDDASSTGATVLRLLDIAVDGGAERVFVYILCNRSDPQGRRALERIQQYGRASVHVRFLAALPIPGYSGQECPICRHALRLEQLRAQWRDCPVLNDVVDAELRRLAPQRLEVVLSEEQLPGYLAQPLESRMGSAALRACLEMAKVSVPIRRRLADTVRSLMTKQAEVLQLFEVLAYEEEVFSADEVLAHEVLYQNLRGSIIQAACELVGRLPTLRDREALVTLAVLRMFSVDRMLEACLACDISGRGSDWLGRAIIELALVDSQGLRRSQIGDIIRAWAEQTRTALLEDALEWYGRPVIRPGTSRRLFDCYLSLLRVLHDSGTLSNDLDGALTATGRPELAADELREAAERFWPDAARVLRSQVVPLLREVGDSDVSVSACKELRAAALSVENLVSTGDDLAAALVDSDTDAVLQEQSRGGFVVVLRTLHATLLAPSSRGVKQSLRLLRVPLGKVVRRAWSHHGRTFAELGIECAVADTFDLPTVFGTAEGIFAIVSILLENVRTHAFPKTWSGLRRAEIGADSNQERTTIDLTIRDNGGGGPGVFKPGIGLTTVQEIASRFCPDLAVGESQLEPFRTEAKVRFFVVPEELA